MPEERTVQLLTHEEYLQQYVLNRALAHNGGLDAAAAAMSAERGWEKIKEILDEEKKRGA